MKNITKDLSPQEPSRDRLEAVRSALKEPAEVDLLRELDQRWPRIERSLGGEKFLEAMSELSHLHGPVDRFFTDVLVMSDDADLRKARLSLLTMLRDTILVTGGDISEIAPAEGDKRA